jgi:Lrp/AsnC family transcriptional regulator, leucine-responsive regulatory protein
MVLDFFGAADAHEDLRIRVLFPVAKYLAEIRSNVLAKWSVSSTYCRVLLRTNGQYSKKTPMMQLDALDVSILRALQGDGRMANATLAEKVGLSPSACSRRLDILEKSGVIRGYHARISNVALGHSVTVIVHMSLSGQSETILSEFEAAVKRCPNVLVCYLMSGEYDYLLRIAAKDLADYERIHKEWLSAMPHVIKINSSFALREVVDRTGRGIDAGI